ncbi:hypothetical protein CJ197_04615 [Brachybacterium sp. UMB0905]|nr:hypothetical protein CJ197_04615 [Brachybacterium sp. UMB0905]
MPQQRPRPRRAWLRQLPQRAQRAADPSVPKRVPAAPRPAALQLPAGPWAPAGPRAPALPQAPAQPRAPSAPRQPAALLPPAPWVPPPAVPPSLAATRRPRASPGSTATAAAPR